MGVDKKEKKLTYISLFSSAGVGCYGFSLEGFECVATVEIIKRRLEVQKYNKKCRYESGYIADDLTLDSSKTKIFSEIEFWRKNHDLKDLDVILSTPPCQGMSVANHRKNNETARNSLVVESIQLVDSIRPRIFIFENVRSFLSTTCIDANGNNKPIRETIESGLGGNYNIHYQIINFKDYGNPSSRTRTLVIGVRKDLQEITPLDLMPKPAYGGSIRNAIGDIPSLSEMGEIDKHDIYHNFRPYAEHMRAWVQKIKEGESAFDNTDTEQRPHKIVGGKIVLNENKNGDKYSRCYWDRPGPCIHTRNDIFASQSTIHPSDDRVFSVRELMRLMSIPNEFKWSNLDEEDLNRMSVNEKRAFLKKEEPNIRQSIGEAVPTTIFKQIARNVKKALSAQRLNDKQITLIIHKQNLDKNGNLKRFLFKNYQKYTYSELAKIAELSNAKRTKHAAYYTRQDICYTIVKDLPDASNYQQLNILEPAVGAGNFIPQIVEKYKTVENVEIDVIDIDPEAIKILQILFKKIAIPKNVKINYIVKDFLLLGNGELCLDNKRYDIVIGNPPFGKIAESTEILLQYKRNKYNTKTNNLFSFFLERCLQIGSTVALILPKSYLSAPEFNKTRELVSNFNICKLIDYGELAFRSVKIETIGIVVDAKRRGNRTLVESYIKKTLEWKKQDYICSSEFPYWLVYRNDYFDKIAKKLQFNIFTAFRDRKITKRITKSRGKFRVLKSRNIGNTRIINIPNYDSYVNKLDTLTVAKYLNKVGQVLVPNLSYAPRACFLPADTIADGSVAVLTKKDPKIKVTKKDLTYYGTEEFSNFYRVARNFGTRSLNIDSNSVFFWGLPRS